MSRRTVADSFRSRGLCKSVHLKPTRGLCDLRYDLIETWDDVEGFHATEDKQPVRNRVFAIIQQDLTCMTIDAVIVEKRKTHPALQLESRFYPEMLGYLLRHVLLAGDLEPYKEVIVMTARHSKKTRQTNLKAFRILVVCDEFVNGVEHNRYYASTLETFQQFRSDS